MTNKCKVRVHDTGNSNRVHPPSHLLSPRLTSPRCLRPTTAAPRKLLLAQKSPSRLPSSLTSKTNQYDQGTVEILPTVAMKPTLIPSEDSTPQQPAPPTRPGSALKPPITPRQMAKRPHTAANALTVVRRSAMSSPSPTAAPSPPPPRHSVEDAAALRSFHRLLQDDDPAKALRSAFLTWDTDRDGVVSEQQCRDMFTSMGWAAKLGDDATAHVLQCVVHPTTRLVALADFCRWQEVDGNAKHNELQHRQVPPLLTTRETISILRKRYDKESLATVFRTWDDTKAGHLTPAMLAHNLAKLHMAVEPSVVHDLVHTYDVDKDGALDFAEFNAFLDGPQIDDHDRSTVIERNRTFKSSAIVGTAPPIVQPGAMSNAVELLRDATEDAAAVEVAERVFQKLKTYKSRIADVFREMDEDESGVLSYAEFRQGLKHKGIQLTEQEFHHLMTDVDKDKNGLVTFQELSAHLNACEKAVQLHLASVPRLTSWTEDDSTKDSKLKYNFDQLRRKVRAPTRRGRTPHYDTRLLITGPASKHNACQADATARFHVESNQFGPCPTSPSISASDKAARATVHAMRQRRIADSRHGQDMYTAMERLKMQMLNDKKATYSPPERTRYYLKLQQRADHDATAWEFGPPHKE